MVFLAYFMRHLEDAVVRPVGQSAICWKLRYHYRVLEFTVVIVNICIAALGPHHRGFLATMFFQHGEQSQISFYGMYGPVIYEFLKGVGDSVRNSFNLFQAAPQTGFEIKRRGKNPVRVLTKIC